MVMRRLVFFKLLFKDAYLVPFQVPHLNLKEGEVPEDLDVFPVPFEGVPVALDGLDVFLVRPLEEAVHVPANMRLQIVSQPSPGKQ